MSATAANWTLGERAVPASWVVTDGNQTGIRCDFARGTVASYLQCREQLGHARGGCFGNIFINGTTVCTCFSFGGWDKSSKEAQHTYGTVSGCATTTNDFYINGVFCSLALLLATFTLLYALSTVWKGRAMCSRNVTNTTLAWCTLASTCGFGWFVCLFLSNIVLRDHRPIVS